MLRAAVYGRGIVSVDFITAAALQFEDPDPNLSEVFLGFVATIPFVSDTAMQDQARNWVIENIRYVDGSNKEIATDINNIHFNLRGFPSAVTLEIGDLK